MNDFAFWWLENKFAVCRIIINSCLYLSYLWLWNLGNSRVIWNTTQMYLTHVHGRSTVILVPQRVFSLKKMLSNSHRNHKGLWQRFAWPKLYYFLTAYFTLDMKFKPATDSKVEIQLKFLTWIYLNEDPIYEFAFQRMKYMSKIIRFYNL